MRLSSRVFPSLIRFAFALTVFLSFTSSSRVLAAEKAVVKDMSEAFSVGTPLTYTKFRSTPAVSETTIRHQVFFDDMEAGTPGWNVINFRQGQPNAWHIASGTQSCVGNAWWCGETETPNGSGYGNNWIQLLTTNVPITLNGTSNNKLTFKYRNRSEFFFDWGWVLIKGGNAGAKWDTLASYSGDFGASCINASLDIPDSFTFVPQPVTLRFAFASDLDISAADSMGNFQGMSIDDVKITAQGNNVRFFDDMETGPSKWVTASPDPGSLWHLENAPGTSTPATCFFLFSNVWVPFQGSGFGLVPDYADAMLTSPPMDLEGVFSPNNPTTALKVQFDDWVNLPGDNSVFWSLWVQGSSDQVTWTPWANATGLKYIGINPQCIEGHEFSFDPYYTPRTGINPGTRYIRLGFRIKDEKLLNDDPGPLRVGFLTEGIYFDNVGVYNVYTISGVETVAGAPASSRSTIRKVFPNPFNPKTKIEFSIAKAGPASVRIFDLQGRAVATLVNEALAPGVYRVPWNGMSDDGKALASGVYFAQIQNGGSRQAVRLTMLK